ncbi:hypothetical protein E6C55_24460 [Cohnella fermenti]|uniref:Uncharacterized protein n=2 Tax=Cohnella fermenti TaxID=2565925 RepID=A0A4S4BJ16_9BACL|nr:hypothetical protein E6C55_24460 [Cohnella fermenti]
MRMGSGTNIADFPGESLAMASSDDAAASARLRGSRGRRLIWGLLSALLAAGMALWALPAPERTNADPPDELNAGIVRESAATEADASGMPALLRFREFEEEPVLGYLHSRDSLLAEEPYFSAIVASAEEYDVNPLLLLAITGQEQGFVPKSGLHAERIANNPFNVFHSWEEYNTDIRDSSRIAAKLIAKLAGSVPKGEEPIAWMNLSYAEDPAWSTGVRLLFEKLTELSELSELSEPSSSLSSLSSEEADLP